ncbi:MAG: WYL domain-containing protein [Burkholderiaceae bacterium]
MDRTERFYKLELLLRSRGCVSFADLRVALEVSPATLKRDLQYLRDRMSAPIVYDASANGYRFAGAAEAQGAVPAATRHELPGLWFSENEIHALMTMHQLLAGLDDDGVLARHLQPLTERLQGMLGADAGESRALRQRIKVIGTARRRVTSRHFELLGSALLQRRRVWLRYFKRSERAASEREVSPQRLVNYRATWYLDAWCHASQGLRRFALDAVRDARMLDQRARTVALRDLEARFDAGYGIYGGAGAQLRWATLVFDADAAQWIANEEWHPQQTSRWLSDGRYELRVPYGDPTELLMDILRHGASVVVQAPPALAADVRQRLADALAAYG